jgi:peptidoglycan/xylan/chitin deacetylase (PgdA/CDA1 family)
MKRADGRATVQSMRGMVRVGRFRRPAGFMMSLLVTVALVLGLLTFSIPASAAGPVVVSLTFDDNTISQYNLAYVQALKPHNAHATFFVKSGSVGTGGSNMSWAQVTTLAGDGNDVGGKTVNATNLTTDPDPSNQVCQDKQNLITHGLGPISFAYPGGANNVTVRDIVKNCGYGNGRTASGLSVGTPTTGTSAETLPPANWFATRAYAPGTVTAANMQSIVTNAASKGGGWIQIVMPGKVCPTQSDPSYSTCISTGSYVTLDDLNSFLTWTENAGQAGGAPVGTTIDTVAHVVTGADNVAPSTAISCNDAPCTTDPYTGSVTVKLSATDSGSGASSIRYTTDGSDPTLSSSPYAGPFGVNGSGTSTTVKFRSWDRANNAEAIQTQVIQAPPDATAPSTTISCNGAACVGTPYVDSVSVTLSAVDTGGSGVDKTYFTTDGSTPDTSSTIYVGAFQLSQPGAYDVKFFTTDHAANAEQVQSQQIQVVPHATIVSLTFDNGTVGQYTLAYQRALRPHDTHATFFVNSGNIGASAQIMTWSQLSDLVADGNDVGGKTVSATNLKTDPDPTSQVCQDRQNLVSHGLDPIAFAYPGGAFDATVKAIVQSCGYGNARSAGSLSPNGPTYAETVPPRDWLATRSYPGSGSPSTMTLSDMQNLVSGAASHGGGWVQLVLTRICSQALDPANYTPCLAASGHIELADLISFLDWVQDAGHAGGAPAGTSIQTVRNVVTAADSVAPTTTSSCDVGPCSDSYNQVVKVTLSPTDLGTGIASTHYTTDGTDPTQSSPTYFRRIAITTPTTLKFRSWDNGGNSEAVRSLLIQATPPPDTTSPTTTISCDDAPCTANAYSGGVMVQLTANDGSGWGIDDTFYTTDGSIPDQTSAAYTGPFQLFAGDHTVKFYSIDFAGNAESVQTQAIEVLPAKTVVSITFDDGTLPQYALAFQRGLQPRNMHGTFYINTGEVEGGPGFVTWANLSTLAADGQDVGGHTAHHIDLTSSSYTQQQKIDEVCNDRQALMNHGISAVSFAYPFGAYDTNAQSIVEDCGYASARRTGGLPANPPPYAETIPPPDPFATRTWTAPTPTDSPIQLADMQAVVNAAATHGGGWVQIVVHEVCSQTYDPSNYGTCLGSFRPIELDTFTGFLDWLQSAGQGGAPAGTVTQSVSEVLRGPDAQGPTTTISCNAGPCLNASWYKTSPVSVTLAATDNPGGAGVDKTFYTTDGSDPTTSSTIYTGPFDVTQTATVKFFSTDTAGNAEQVQSKTIQIDTSPPLTTIACNGAACLGTYDGPVSVSLAVTDAASGGDKTYYTTDGSTPTTLSTTYIGPFDVGQTTTVKFFSTDLAGNVETAKSQLVDIQTETTPPVTTITCNGAPCGGGVFKKGPVKIVLSATDSGGSGVATTYYTTNGSTPTTSSTVYVGQFNIMATTTVRFFSTDRAGNAEAAQSQQITIDGTAPTTTISCDGAPCSTGWYKASPVFMGLSATDTGGSGVDKTYYTTDGTTPTTSSPVYSGSVAIGQTTTVKFFSIDRGGNKESVKSTTIRIDTVAPSVSVTSPTSGESFKKGAKVSLGASAADAGTGTAAASGVAKVVYYLDSTTVLGTDTSAPYSVTWNTIKVALGTHTITAVATDAAGNSTTSAAITITITS